MKKKINLIRTLCHRESKICSKDLFVDEITQIKLILNKNGYPQGLVNKTINLHLKSWDKINTARHEKCSITLLLLYVNKYTRIIEKNINQLISKSYYSAKPKVIFLSKPIIRPWGKDPIS